MQVLKFGGSSVANAENINKVLQIIQNKQQGNRTIVVVSALGGITDLFLETGKLASEGDEVFREKLLQAENRYMETAKAIIPITNQSRSISIVKTGFNELEDICNGVFLLKELSAATKDRIVSYGELLSSQIIAAALQAKDINTSWVDARELIFTDSNHTFAAVNFAVSYAAIEDYFSKDHSSVTLVPGFIASDDHKKTTTLGRGGSDYTAAIIAAALNAPSLEIWTDVSGMMTADPRMVATAKVIPHISYQEAMELSHFGAKVIYPPTIQPALKQKIPIWIKNTFAPEDEGTLIENKISEGNNIRGISSINHVVLLSLEGSGMIGIPGFSKRLFEALADNKINVILITQASSEHSICVGIDQANTKLAKKVIDETFLYEIETGKVDPITIEEGLSIVALVGDNMKNHTGISGKMFGALGRNGVNIRAISQGSSERNISVVIIQNDVKKALNILHEEFFETTYKVVHLFLVGVGNVGAKFLAQLQKQQQYLRENLRMIVKVIGMANSKKMIFDDEGIDLDNWQEKLSGGETMTIDSFVDTIVEKNFRNAVFTDITANESIAKCYDKLLQKSISVVACNKIAASSPYDYYQKLKDLASEFNAHFLFETNVGAGLPVIGTLNDLLRSGDKVNKMEAVLSGTLNFVFNNYDGSRPFADVVKQAQDEGYTEPDPRLDLGGTDVMRKIMILAREAGEHLEMDAISNQSFMPPACMQGSVEDFYAEMKKHESHFQSLLDKANEADAKLKFVASYADGKAAVGLQHIPSQHDLYHLYGKDNVVLFYTDRYVEQPLVIKGAGAGAEVTASGVFADVIRAGR